MPDLFEGTEVTGKIKSEIAQNWGLSDNVKIVAGAGDNAASAISMGSVNAHTAYLSLGTSATFLLPAKNINQILQQQFIFLSCGAELLASYGRALKWCKHD